MFLNSKYNLSPLNVSNLLERSHSLLTGATYWWLTIPNLAGSNKWYNLIGSVNGTLTNMNSGSSGWRGASRPGGFGELNFDGSNDFVTGGTAPTIGTAYTWSIWLCGTTVSGTGGTTQPLQVGSSSDSFGFSWGHTNGTFTRSLWHKDAGNTYSNIAVSGGSNALAASTWYHLVGTWSGTILCLYVNGVKQTGSGVGATSVKATAGSLFVGASASSLWPGKIDDFILWNRDLSATEVRALYEQSINGYPDILRRINEVSYFLPTDRTQGTINIVQCDLLADKSLFIDTTHPANKQHSLNTLLSGWWLTLPNLAGGQKLYDLINNNNGTLTGGAAYRSTVRKGGYGQITLDGTDDYVLVANNAKLTPTDEITISCWCIPTPTNNPFLVDKNFTSGGYWVQLFGTNAIEFGVKQTGSVFLDSSNNAFASNTWQMITCTYSTAKATIRIYVNGVKVAENTSASGGMGSNSNDLYIGRQASANQSYLNSPIDDIRIYSRALSPTEVYELYATSSSNYSSLLNKIHLSIVNIPGAVAVGQQFQALWNLKAAIAQYRQALWNVYTSISKTNEYDWAIRTSVADTLSCLWNLRQAVGRSSNDIWNVLANVGLSREFIWNVSNITSANQDISLLWNVLANVGNADEIVWSVRKLAGRSTQEIWNLSGSVAAAKQILWNTRALINNSKNIPWNVRIVLNKQVQELWHVYQNVGSEEEFLWNVLWTAPVIEAIHEITLYLMQVYNIDADITKDEEITLYKEVP
jgi:hypothetical protein